MYKEPKEMKEIHDIRVKMYEKTKNMTDNQYVTFIHREAEEFEKQTGIRFKKVIHAKV